MSTVVQDKPKQKYRLMRGLHIDENGIKHQVERDPVTKQARTVEFETTLDLDSMFNSAGHKPKFEKVTDGPVIVNTNPTDRLPGESVQAYVARLNELTASITKNITEKLKLIDTYDKEQLEELADEEEIDLKAAKNVEQMRTIVKNALKAS